VEAQILINNIECYLEKSDFPQHLLCIHVCWLIDRDISQVSKEA